MDPITSAIVFALAIGVAGGAGKVGNKVIVDAYEALKIVLQQKYGTNNDLTDAIQKLEEKPDSASRKGLLQEEIEAVAADQDQEVIEVARVLEELLNEQFPRENNNQTITGHNNQTIQSKAGRDVTVNVSSPKSSKDMNSKKAKPLDLDQIALEFTSEISNVTSNYYDPLDLVNSFDAWELAISSKLRGDKEKYLDRVENISDIVDQVAFSNDESNFDPANLRKEVREITKIAKAKVSRIRAMRL